MSPSPRLTSLPTPEDVRAVVLVLHGGREVSTAPARATQLAVVRMVPIARALARAGGPHGLAVARLRFALRGWNGELRSPVGDARDALDRLAARHPGVPIAIVGHSMGGRTALAVADHPAVSTIVGLAPWIEASDGTSAVTGRQVLLVHGSADRITDPRRSKRFVENVEGLASSASYISVSGDKHAMLRRPAVWNALASGYVLAALCAVPPGSGRPGETAGDETTNVLQMALAGRPALVV